MIDYYLGSPSMATIIYTYLYNIYLIFIECAGYFAIVGLQKLTIRSDSSSESSLHSPMPNGDINGPISPTPQLKTPTFNVCTMYK